MDFEGQPVFQAYERAFLTRKHYMHWQKGQKVVMLWGGLEQFTVPEGMGFGLSGWTLPNAIWGLDSTLWWVDLGPPKRYLSPNSQYL